MTTLPVRTDEEGAQGLIEHQEYHGDAMTKPSYVDDPTEEANRPWSDLTRPVTILQGGHRIRSVKYTVNPGDSITF